MSSYTLQLREIIGNFYSRSDVEGWFSDYELSDYLTEEQIASIEAQGTWTKQKLAKKIVDHYFMREIGYETFGLFRHYAKVKMQEIMEEKLPLIYSSSIKYDPLVNVDFTEKFTRDINSTGTSSSSSSSNSSGLTIGSDTPQGQINKQSILDGSYATDTNASETEASVSDSTNTSGSSDENYVKTMKGNSGVSATAQKMVQQYRDNIIAIDKEIIKELNSLFMGIY